MWKSVRGGQDRPQKNISNIGREKNANGTYKNKVFKPLII